MKTGKIPVATALLVVLSIVVVACGDSTATTGPAASGATSSSGAVSKITPLTDNHTTGTEKPSPLRVGLVPNQNPETIKAQYASFKTYLEKALGIPVELFVGSDYPGVVTAMTTDKLDLAYFGGLTYLQAREQSEVYPIVTEVDRFTNDRTYYSVIIVPADSPVQKVEELKGKTFAFGDVASTSGSLYPRIMLDQAGLKVPGDFKEVKYTGGHDATALSVQNGSIDAGGLEERILQRLIDQGKIDPKKIRIIKRSEGIMGYPWVVRSKLDKDYVEKIINAFINIKDPELLKLMRAENYTKVNASDYNYAREQAIRLGLLVPKK